MTKSLITQILRRGVGLSTDTDSELIAQLIAKALADRPEDDTDNMDITNVCNKT
jgi:glucosamine 6-phosphate synthetase-like amidotransferase/phosphosugar isomerase protein